MKSKKFVFAGMFILLILFGVLAVSADFLQGKKTYDISDTYSQYSSLNGWINLSFDNESAGSLFTYYFGSGAKKSFTLQKLLDANPDSDYSCNPESCQSTYSALSPSTEKTISLSNGGEALIGFKITDDVSETKDINLSLNISSDAPNSCTNQLEVDFFDDNEIDFKNENASASLDRLNLASCAPNKDYGCFSSSRGEYKTLSSEDFSCQRLSLSEAPLVIVGSKLQLNKPGPQSVSFKILDKNLSIQGDECTATITGNKGDKKTVRCAINYQIHNKTEFYVCAKAENPNTVNIKRYSGGESSELCGFYGIPGSSDEINENSAYEIFAKPAEFGAVNIKIPLNDEINQKLKRYLKDTYGSQIDCTQFQDGCIIPIRINAKDIPQTVTVKDALLEYSETSGPVSKQKFYLLDKEYPEISSDFQKFNLDKLSLKVPDVIGKHKLTLKFGGKTLIDEEEIEVLKGVQILGIIPEETAALVSTDFVLLLENESLSNVTKYEWDFGDGSLSEESPAPVITHTYSDIGNYNLTVTLTDSLGSVISKNFNIKVGSPKEMVKPELDKKTSIMESFITQYNSLDSFQKSILSESLNYSEMQSELLDLQAEYQKIKGNGTDEDYVNLMSRLVELNIPTNLTFEEKQKLSLYTLPESINVDFIKSIYGDSVNITDDLAYKNAIVLWSQENAQLTGISNKLTVKYGKIDDEIGYFYKISINANDNRQNSFMILDLPNDVAFKSNYSQKYQDGLYYLPLTSSEKSIEFFSSEEINLADLPIAVSPPLSALSVVQLEEEAPPKSQAKKWIIFGIIMAVLIALAVMAYFLLAKWYKTKYEDYLFKNKNDLINIFSFVHQSKEKGIPEKEIRSSLKKAGWNSEQINYAVRKYLGKPTGMFEFRRKVKEKQELEKATSRAPPKNAQRTPPNFGRRPF